MFYKLQCVKKVYEDRDWEHCNSSHKQKRNKKYHRNKSSVAGDTVDMLDFYNESLRICKT